jgi:ABC-type iron transport system FetAB permease component
VVLNAALTWVLDLGLSRTIVIAGVRAIVQFLLVGMVLKTVFALASPLLIGAVALAMFVMASYEISSRGISARPSGRGASTCSERADQPVDEHADAW